MDPSTEDDPRFLEFVYLTIAAACLARSVCGPSSG